MQFVTECEMQNALGTLERIIIQKYCLCIFFFVFLGLLKGLV